MIRYLAQPTNPLPCIYKQKNLKIVGCLNIDRNNALRVGRLLGCSVYCNIENAIKNKNYDLVVIASPDHIHLDQIKTTFGSQWDSCFRYANLSFFRSNELERLSL